MQTTEKSRQCWQGDFYRGSLCCHQATSSLWRYTHLMDHELIDNPKSNPQWVLRIHSQYGDPLSHKQSTRVALCDPHRVSIVPLTISSLEHHTISLRASTESQVTKPSWRWQPPRVTSTTSLQHEHLVPLDAISQCNRTRIVHSHNWMITIKHMWVRGFTITLQAWTLSLKGAQLQPRPATTSIYSPKGWNSCCPFIGQNTWAPNALQGATGRSNLVSRCSGDNHMSLPVWTRPLPPTANMLLTLANTTWILGYHPQHGIRVY